jgi:hypothetical protein
MPEYNAFNLGIEDTAVYSNLSDAEEFLSDGAAGILDTSEIKSKEVAEAEEKKKEEEKKTKEAKIKAEEATKLSVEDEVNEFLGEDEEPPVVVKGASVKKEEESDAPFEVISKQLFELGIFTNDEEGDPVLPSTPEEFADRFRQQAQTSATTWLDNYLEKFGEDRRRLFDDIFINGVEPKEYLSTYNNIESLAGVDLEDENIQERVVRNYYEQAGWSADKIENKITKLKTTFDLEDEAKTVHPIILDKEKAKLDEQVAQKQEKLQQAAQADEEYKNGISKLLGEKLKQKNFDGIPLTEKEAKSAFDFLYTKKWKTANGELLTDYDKFILESKKPENVGDRIKIALLKQSGFDFSKIEKKAIGKESNLLFQGLATQKKAKQQQESAQAKSSSAWSTL